jgi:putative two-component system response regulator
MSGIMKNAAEQDGLSEENMNVNLKTDYENETKAPFTDGLTGLFNHGFFQLALDNEVKRSQRYGNPFTMALIDVDSFANYNRHYGPARGDRILKEIAGIVKKNIRDVDIAARYSGDVFALILTECKSSHAASVMERIRQDVEMLTGEHETISIGIADYPAASDNKESFIKKTEEALIRAKIKGKNRVNIYKEEKNLFNVQAPRILIVDDEPKNIKLLEAFLLPFNYEILKAENGEDALSIVSRTEVDMVLLDVMMPLMDGFEVCRRIKDNENTRMIPVVMVTALDDTDARVKAIELGADDFITKPPNRIELLARVKSLIKVKILNNTLTSLESVLFSLANTVEAKDEYTSGHTLRVSELAVELGKKMELHNNDINAIKIGGIIHDLGKIGVPKAIINKPGRLDPEEFEIMKTHPYIGYKICIPLKRSLGMVLDIIYYHHEKLDGSGYPVGLKGDDIPVGAKVLAVADIYDALTSDRPYRKAMSKEKAMAILSQEAGEGKLDTQIVEYLMELVK